MSCWFFQLCEGVLFNLYCINYELLLPRPCLQQAGCRSNLFFKFDWFFRLVGFKKRLEQKARTSSK